MFFLVLNTLWGQEQPPEILYRKFESEISLTGLFLTPYLGYGIKKSAIYAAPLLPFGSASLRVSPGVTLGYKFYPIGRDGTTFFLGYNIFYYKSLPAATFNGQENFNLVNVAGSGFDLRLWKEIYFMSEFGVGIQRRWNTNYSRMNSNYLFKFGFRKRFIKT